MPEWRNKGDKIKINRELREFSELREIFNAGQVQIEEIALLF